MNKKIIYPTISFIVLSLIIPLVKANMVIPNVYIIYQEYLLIILPIIFLLSYFIELTIIYLFLRRRVLSNYASFILYIFFMNLITFPLTHLIVFYTGLYLFSLSMVILFFIEFIPIIIESQMLKYYFTNLYYNRILRKEKTDYLGISTAANLSSYFIGVIIVLFISGI